MELFKMPFILTKRSQILVVGLRVWLSYNWRSVHDFLLRRRETPRCWEQSDTLYMFEWNSKYGQQARWKGKQVSVQTLLSLKKKAQGANRVKYTCLRANFAL